MRTAGFALIEVAIVLAIAGVVIGGIWVAGNEVMLQMNIRNAQEQKAITIKNYRELYAQRNPATLPATPPTNLSLLLDQAQVFPADMRENPTVAAGNLSHAAANVTNSVAVGYNNIPRPIEVWLEFRNVVQPTCQRWLPLEGKREAAAQGLRGISVMAGTTTSNFAAGAPITPENAVQACADPNDNRIRWTYAVR